MNKETIAPPEETVAHFVFFSDLIRADKSLKARAFKPNPHNEISVFCIGDIIDENQEIWELKNYIRTDKEPKGRGDLKVLEIHQVKADIKNNEKLSVIIDEKPHPRHANIKITPSNRSIENAVCAELAKKSKFVEYRKEN